MFCPAFEAGRCRSCTLLDVPYADQLAAKQVTVAALLAVHGDPVWEPPVPSAPAGYRNKAKLVVGGTCDEPTLGILDAAGHGVDLTDCLLYDDRLVATFGELAAFVTRAGLTPYDVPARRGELKHVLVTVSPDGELLVRFVLRSTEALARIQKHAVALLAALPQVRVLSVNLQPEHKAVLEGAREVLLTGEDALSMRLNALPLFLHPRGFFQTNSAVAAALYRQAAAWIGAAGSVWDLYSGVGGFAVHAAAAGARDVTGVETSGAAVAGARRSAALAGLAGVRFLQGDATAFALAAPGPPEVVVVNPPRRGIGAALAGWLEHSGAARVLYSSCNPDSLVRDLAAMPSLHPTRARLLDMFPQTAHEEVLVLLERAAPSAL